MSKNKYLVVILILYGFLGITTNLLCNSTLNNNRLNNNSGNDSSSVDVESKFSVKGYLSAQNKSVRDGFTVNNGISESELGAEISYFDFSITGLADKQVSANIWTYYSISLGYLHSFNDWFDLSLGVSQFKYKKTGLYGSVFLFTKN